MPTIKQINELIINQIESQEVYNTMVAQNLINEDELYLVQGEAEDYITAEELEEAIASTSSVQIYTWEDED